MANVRCLVRGSLNVDEYFRVRDIVKPGETISSDDLQARPGGKGLNQSVAVARAGGNVTLVGAVGDDGTWVVDQVRAAGVDVSSVAIAKERTGRAIIQVAEDGENSIVLFKGANYAQLPPPRPTNVYTHVLLQNEIPFDATLAYLNLAESTPNISTVFNPSPMPSKIEIQNFPWHNLTWLVVNKGEAMSLLETLNDFSQDTQGPTSTEAIILSLRKFIPKTNIVCTLGSSGVAAMMSHWSRPLILPAAKLQNPVRDTTGAGDCFTGYFVAGLIKLEQQGKAKDQLSESDVRSILYTSVQAAGICVEREGAMASIPSKSEVENRVRSAIS